MSQRGVAGLLSCCFDLATVWSQNSKRNGMQCLLAKQFRGWWAGGAFGLIQAKYLRQALTQVSRSGFKPEEANSFLWLGVWVNGIFLPRSIGETDRLNFQLKAEALSALLILRASENPGLASKESLWDPLPTHDIQASKDILAGIVFRKPFAHSSPRFSKKAWFSTESQDLSWPDSRRLPCL